MGSLRTAIPSARRSLIQLRSSASTAMSMRRTSMVLIPPLGGALPSTGITIARLVLFVVEPLQSKGCTDQNKCDDLHESPSCGILKPKGKSIVGSPSITMLLWAVSASMATSRRRSRHRRQASRVRSLYAPSHGYHCRARKLASLTSRGCWSCLATRRLAERQETPRESKRASMKPSARAWLQSQQAGTKFAGEDNPPSARWTTWSIWSERPRGLSSGVGS